MIRTFDARFDGTGSKTALPGIRLVLYLLFVTPLALACEPKLVVGSWQCPEAKGTPEEQLEAPVATGWSSGFEDGFCGFERMGGFCYMEGDASHDVVTEPVHSGKHAAAFRVVTPDSLTGSQTRCVRQGELPAAAYYGAWYYIPTGASALDNWNLFHFQGGEAHPLHGLWDVTITADADGALRLSVLDFLNGGWHHAPSTFGVPLGSWFHIQVYLKRATDTTGEFALYQDGKLAVDLDGIRTDDSTFGRWYVGNLARFLNPPESTVYVDDVSIRDEL